MEKRKQRSVKTVTRQDLAAAVAVTSVVSRTEAAELVREILTIVSDAIVSGDEVRLSGFGKFGAVERAPRKARDVHANRLIHLGRRQVIAFRPAAGLVRKLNNAVGDDEAI
jgi:integration host factor subunit alpha